MQEPSQTLAGQRLSLPRANYALGVFLLAYILSFVDRQILSLMVDPIRQDLNLSDIEIGLLQGFAFAILYATMGVPFGMWADRGSRRNIITIGVTFWSAATAMCGLAGSFVQLFLARVCVGVGEATLSPAAHSYLSDAFERHKLSRAMAIFTLGITIGGGMALIVGGMVVDLIANTEKISVPVLGELRSWQAAFLVVSTPGVLVAILVRFTREPPRGLGADGKPSGAARIGEILRYLRLHWRAFFAIHFSSACIGVYGYGMLGWYPTLLIRSFDFTPGQAGLWLGLSYLVLGSLGAITGGYLAEKLTLKGYKDANLRMVMWVAMAVIVPATLAPLMPQAWLVIAFFAIACYVFNGYFCCSIAAIQLASPPSMRGTSAALFLLTNSLVGMSIGMVVVPVVDKWLFGGNGQLGPALAVIAFSACAACALIAYSGLKFYGQLAESLATNSATGADINART